MKGRFGIRGRILIPPAYTAVSGFLIPPLGSRTAALEGSEERQAGFRRTGIRIAEKKEVCRKESWEEPPHGPPPGEWLEASRRKWGSGFLWWALPITLYRLTVLLLTVPPRKSSWNLGTCQPAWETFSGNLANWKVVFAIYSHCRGFSWGSTAARQFLPKQTGRFCQRPNQVVSPGFSGDWEFFAGYAPKGLEHQSHKGDWE